MTEDPSDTLFVGFSGVDGVAHYRTILPAKALGAEYVIFDGDGRGIARSGTKKEHKLIVIQHGWTKLHTRIARRMRDMGAFTVINVDDWIKGVGRMEHSHAFAKNFRDKDVLREHESLLREADGLLAATPWLTQRLRGINPNTACARNGLDLGRYERWHADERDMGTILGWAGGTGHREALASIVPAIETVMATHPDLQMMLVGDDLRSLFSQHLDRVHYRGWSEMAFYPRDLACFDINLAPAMTTDFYKAKSQLRFYEACAMGTPTVGHPMYDEIQPGLTGHIAADSDEWVNYLDLLVQATGVRNDMRSRCLEYAQSISIESRTDEWTSALKTLTSP